MKNENTICRKCVMSSSVPSITFDSEGVCNFCGEAEIKLQKYKYSEEDEDQNLRTLSEQIKSARKGKYDSIVGLSGGVDSSYVAYLAKSMGLNPLCVHFDNGWNSEIAVSNIKKIVDSCQFDLMTYVINWPEFRDLQRSFFKADVVDIEMLTDHAITATMYKLHRQNNTKYILSGTNYATEHGFPPGVWSWVKQDLSNIKDIQKKFGTKKIREYPTLSTLKMKFLNQLGSKVKFVPILNLVSYSKTKAMKILKEEFDWEYYGGKHYESVFTKFYQAYILPTKFGIDKRMVHLSAQIRNGEISRKDALDELTKPLYDDEELAIDKSYVLKKLGFTAEEFEMIMNSPPKSHLEYKSDQRIVSIVVFLERWIARMSRVLKLYK